MTTARRNLISLDDTPYYHCIARCVRRAFLCGDDPYTRKNFNHRRQWLVERIKTEASVFAIDICAYAIMHNHYHLVLHVDRAQASNWTQEEVIQRWCTLFSPPLLVQDYMAGETLGLVELDTVKAIVAVWRERLMNISWFMRCLNQFIACKANAEDDCKGRFWEGRFKSQALLDDRALLSCMAYVDLNPVRAGLAKDLPGSDFTSIQERLFRRAPLETAKTQNHFSTALFPFSDRVSKTQATACIPFSERAYMELVDWTGKHARLGKRGVINSPEPAALSTLQTTREQWLGLSLEIQKLSLQAIGNLDALDHYTRGRGVQWMRGQSRVAALYASR
jgi:putative transposase